MEKEKLYDKWTATGLETIKACVEDKIANYCELNKKQCQEVLNFIEKQQKEIELMKTKINKIVLMIKENYNSDFYDDYETISVLRDDIYNLLMKNNIGE